MSVNFTLRLHWRMFLTQICKFLHKSKWNTGCNIGSKTLLAKQGKLPLKFTCPVRTSTCPATLLNKGELHCEDPAQNITCRSGKVRVLFYLSHCCFCRIHLQLSSSYVARWHCKANIQFFEIGMVDFPNILTNSGGLQIGGKQQFWLLQF